MFHQQFLKEFFFWVVWGKFGGPSSQGMWAKSLNVDVYFPNLQTINQGRALSETSFSHVFFLDSDPRNPFFRASERSPFLGSREFFGGIFLVFKNLRSCEGVYIVYARWKEVLPLYTIIVKEEHHNRNLWILMNQTNH